MAQREAAPVHPRRHGKPPFRAVLVHGGPGAPGSLGQVGRVLGLSFGVLEPWQSATTVAGQVEELSGQIGAWASPPVTLIGHSWGAWLSFLLAEEHPEQVRSLVLIGCGPLTTYHAAEVDRRRRQRLSPGLWKEFEECRRRLENKTPRPRRSVLRRLGELAEVADSYELLAHPAPRNPPDPRAFQAVWREAEGMRRSGALVRALHRVQAPILVIHGEADPHPFRGVIEPLRRGKAAFRVVLLPRCGHEPWWERYASDRFFEELRTELARVLGKPEGRPPALRPRRRGRSRVGGAL